MLALPAKLNISSAGTVLPELERELDAGNGALTVDASALTQFDSSAIAALLALRRRVVAQQRAFAVSGAPKAMVELAQIYGVAELLGLSGRAPAAA